MNSSNNSKIDIIDNSKDNLKSKELFLNSSDINSLQNEILTIEIPKLEENKKNELLKNKKQEPNNKKPLYIILSLLLEQFSYNKILDSMIKIKEERYFSKLDKIINTLISSKGYSYFIKELITVKNDIDNMNILQKEKQEEKKRINIYKNKNIINVEDKDDSSSGNNSFISKKEFFRKKNMYSLRASRNLNRQLYLDSISNSEEESLENMDDLEISLEEEKKESEIDREIDQEKSDSSLEQKNNKVIDLSKKSNERKQKNNNINEDLNDKNYDIEIDLINQREEKNSNSRQRYYQKGGKYGMHYYLSDKDQKIYKYYSVQYNGDKSIGFRCTDTNCRSKAILFPKNKEFRVLSNHTLKFEEHKKLQGSMKHDKFIKAMENNNLKEIQLTKKDNIKEILWFK